MQQWEYLFVQVQALNGGFTNHKPRYVNGKELENWREGPSIDEYANLLGEDGWELVSFTHIQASISLMSFMRPKTENT